MSLRGKYRQRTADVLSQYISPYFSENLHRALSCQPTSVMASSFPHVAQETASCYLWTTPHLLLSSVIMCATMHHSKLLLHISYSTVYATRRQAFWSFHTILAYWAIIAISPGWDICTVIFSICLLLLTAQSLRVEGVGEKDQSRRNTPVRVLKNPFMSIGSIIIVIVAVSVIVMMAPWLSQTE